jgi:hypothetical protein
MIEPCGIIRRRLAGTEILELIKRAQVGHDLFYNTVPRASISRATSTPIG